MTPIPTPLDIESIPTEFALHQNVPNPFNPKTTVTFDLPEQCAVRLTVHSITGQLVRVLASGTMPAGRFETAWDGRSDTGVNVASGVYLCRLSAGDHVLVRRMLLAR